MGLSDKVLGLLITASAVAIFTYYSIWVLVVVSGHYSNLLRVHYSSPLLRVYLIRHHIHSIYDWPLK